MSQPVARNRKFPSSQKKAPRGRRRSDPLAPCAVAKLDRYDLLILDVIKDPVRFRQRLLVFGIRIRHRGYPAACMKYGKPVVVPALD